ncbi:MAG: hypothetical protein ACI88G_001995 [Woeseiaceae bacterium]|jgi:hypothetical protein
MALTLSSGVCGSLKTSAVATDLLYLAVVEIGRHAEYRACLSLTIQAATSSDNSWVADDAYAQLTAGTPCFSIHFLTPLVVSNGS